jgi:hypothetical protein
MITHVNASPEFLNDVDKMKLLAEMADHANKKFSRKKYYLIQAAKTPDGFYIMEATEHIYLFCDSLDDLQKTLQCIIPKAFKMPSARRLSININSNHKKEAILINKLTGVTMFTIREIKENININLTMNHTNKQGFKHVLNLVDSNNWK